jgi:hypothetical protein
MASRYSCSMRSLYSVGNGTRCPVVEGFAAYAAHRIHLVRSTPGGKHSWIARRRVISDARLMAFSSMRASFIQPAAHVTTAYRVMLIQPGRTCLYCIDARSKSHLRSTNG